MAKLNDATIVHGDPTKDFFIYMLVKDITLRDAIGDLVDNSVDAIKAKAADPTDLSDYFIKIKINKTSFSMIDNGSGMEADVARKYAFNFGKSPSHKLINQSIGQFGIGMKRAFFKLGSTIKVKSKASTSNFELTIDVHSWQKETDSWNFKFDAGSLKENVRNNSDKTGLEITVTNLSTDSKTSFSDDNFIDKLRKEIGLEHMLNINKGLKIVIEDFTLPKTEIALVMDDKIKPTYWEQKAKDQSVKIIAGISAKEAEDGGWYIFCNERLIMAKDQSPNTVWTGKKGDGVPLYHAQYHRFRGYVFFEAKDSAKLPWTTTKTGMDMDSPYYKDVRSKMIDMTKQVMALLDKLKEEKEKENPVENQTLNKVVEKSKATSVIAIMEESSDLNYKFHYPEKLFNPAKKGKNTITVSYQISSERYQLVKQHIGVSSAKEVGLKTFAYYYDNEL